MGAWARIRAFIVGVNLWVRPLCAFTQARVNTRGAGADISRGRPECLPPYGISAVPNVNTPSGIVSPFAATTVIRLWLAASYMPILIVYVPGGASGSA